MNATQSYVPPPHTPHHGYLEQSHMSAHPHQPTSAPSPYYAPGPMVPPGPMGYAPYPQHHYPTYGHPVTSGPAHSAPPAYHHQQPMHHQGMVIPSSMPSTSQAGAAVNEYARPLQDTTGQIPPPGLKPKLTGTVWEDEGTLCFQVEVRGICVARREDNCFINGTKLLNVANMTRGRRDGILKSEKTRSVIKIGPMHLKGVWIPFERALEFANKEKITEQLYPLFVHNISPMLAPHYQNQMAQGRRPDTAAAAPSTSAAPVSTPPTTAAAPAPQTSGVQTPATSGRPGLDRAHTFPTPPASATSVSGHAAANSYTWEQPPSMPLDSSATSMHANNKSMPATPTTTPPDGVLYSSGPGYDTGKSMYSTPHQTPHYPSSYASMPPPKKEDEHDPHSRDYGQAYAGAAEYPYGEHHGDVKSGQLTPKATPQSWHNGYSSAPPRQIPSSNLAYVIGDGSNNYPSSYASTNGSSNKRVREIDDDEAESIESQMKKRKTGDSGLSGYSQPRSTLVRQ